MREPETVKLLAYLEETDYICNIAHAVRLHALNVPGAYRDHIAQAIRVEIARLIAPGYPLDPGRTAERGWDGAPKNPQPMGWNENMGWGGRSDNVVTPGGRVATATLVTYGIIEQSGWAIKANRPWDPLSECWTPQAD